jgi:hypothetical protein
MDFKEIDCLIVDKIFQSCRIVFTETIDIDLAYEETTPTTGVACEVIPISSNSNMENFNLNCCIDCLEHKIKTISEFFVRIKITLLPNGRTIEKIVNEVLQKAENKVISLINESITYSQKIQLDKLIEAPDETVKTTLAYLKEDPGQSSPKAFMDVIERLEIIRKLKLKMNINGIHPNRIRQLSRLGSKYEPYSFRRFDKNKR